MRKLWKFGVAAALSAGIAAAIYFAARRAAGTARPQEPTARDAVEEASMESFPASDAPSWIGAALQ